MSDYQIVLKNIKNIKELVFPFPQKKGVYVLTGGNGSGKTSLLTALSRLGNRNAFAHYRSNKSIDQYNHASVEYITPNGQVRYVHGAQRWVPNPKRNSIILSQFPFHDTKFITAAGPRFYTQEQLGNGRLRYTSASPYIKKGMNDIMGTTKFNDLLYTTIDVIHGRQRNPHRDDKLYVVKNQNVNYSEQNFSLGERLLLNSLEELETVQSQTLVLIDEVELSLHPIAQVKFYDFLEAQAREKELCIILSTHSSTLIKHAKKRIFLESEDGIVIAHTDCYPSYILRTISSDEDLMADCIFFVEDEMAMKYLYAILWKYTRDINSDISYKILPVGGFKEVIKMLESYPTIGYPKKKIQAFLDKDVEESYRQLEELGNSRSKSKQATFELFNRNRDNINYLNITPELGIWEWMTQHPAAINEFYDNTFGKQVYSMQSLISSVNVEEEGNKNKGEGTEQEKLRKWAKGCFKNFAEKVSSKNPQLSNEEIIKSMINCYVENNYDINQLKSVFCPLFKRIK